MTRQANVFGPVQRDASTMKDTCITCATQMAREGVINPLAYTPQVTALHLFPEREVSMCMNCATITADPKDGTY